MMSAAKILIIGYGNTLRGDDGVGPYVVELLARENWRGMQTRTVQQLTPELCSVIAEQDAVIFVDASLEGEAEWCHWTPPFPPLPRGGKGGSNGTIASPSHFSSPASLLVVVEELYQRKPLAWCLSIPGENFDLGETLSDRALQNAQQALLLIKQLLSTIETSAEENQPCSSEF